MKKLIKVKKEVDVKYLCFDVEPRYWEDSEINNQEDDPETPKMPLAYFNEKEKVWKWKLKINVDNGHIQNWPNGTKASIHYKVCDQGRYWFEDENGNILMSTEDGAYVPYVMDIYDDSYGDYLIMNIEDDGHIVDWDRVDRKLDLSLESLLSMED